jgi:hypothetical protein
VTHVAPKNSLEQRAQKLIFDAGDRGITQSDLWKKLGVSSREGSRLSLKFEEKGIIERRKVLHGGRWSYRIYTKREMVTMDSITSCPCLVCEDIDKCFEGGVRDPISCLDLTGWIDPRKTE